jgi:hypothetical protein
MTRSTERPARTHPHSPVQAPLRPRLCGRALRRLVRLTVIS